MRILFLGIGGAFAPMSMGNSNMLITADSGKRMMIDWGTTAPYIYRDEMGLDFKDIDAMYITHQHGDHMGGMELFAFSRFFIPLKDAEGHSVRPKLFAVRNLMKELWESLKGGLESLQGKIMTLTDYFDCHPVTENSSFEWEGYKFTPVQTIHVRSGYIIKYSYGLAIRKIITTQKGWKTSRLVKDEYDAYITSDTQFDRGLIKYYESSKIIFHDCETGPYKSIVHPHYDDLMTLPEDCKKKMWLYHYGKKVDSVVADGFAGFVDKGQEFEF